HFFLGNFSDDLAVSEQQSLTTSAGDADIGFFRLTGTVYGAAELRYLDRRSDIGNVLLDLVGNADQIDFDPSTGRTGNQGGRIGRQTEGLEQFPGHLHFLDGIGAQGNADGGSDSLGQQCSEPGGTFYRSGEQGTGFGNPQMEGIAKGCGRLLVCFNGQPNVGGFQGDHDIREIEILENTDMIQRTFHHAVRRRVTVFFQHPFLQGSRVHSDPDGNPPFLGRLYHCLHLFPASDVPRVDADFIDPALDRFQGQTIVKMDVRHQRNRNLLFDYRLALKA